LAELLRTLTETWSALATPRRAVPIGFVALPLLAAQWIFARNVPALASAVATLVAFVALGPAAWRVLFPMDRLAPPLPGVMRLGLYVGLAAFVTVLTGSGVPGLYAVPSSFLTVGPSLAITFAMFVVGGWGLGRDIDMERGVARERERAERLEREKDRAQLLAIRAQLDPHFLFNTLNAIAEWTREDPEVAETALLRLAEMLRTVLSAVTEPVWSLAEELALLDDLLALHHVRDPERFTVSRRGWEEVVDGVVVPPMLLLPLVENAMKHGPSAGHRGEVVIALRRTADQIVVELSNPGPYTGPRAGGQGVAMVRRRLALTYGEEGSVVLRAQGDDRTQATVRLPPAPRGPTA
jgi:two-component system sensor histidine kinase AlgZ